jgi:hypothetical protein
LAERAHVLTLFRPSLKDAASAAEFTRSIAQTLWRRERAQLLEAIIDETPVNALTLSIGVAYFVDGTVDMVLEAQAMCDVARRAGGNRVIVHRGR